MAATSSNLFHPCHKSLRSTFQSSGTYALVHPPLSTFHLPSSLENPPSTIPRSAPLMVTMPARATSQRAPNPRRLSTSAPTHILPGQVQSGDTSCHARTALSRILVGILGQNQEAAPEPPILPAVAQALFPSDAVSQAFAEFVGGHETFVFLRNGYTPSKLSYEKYTGGDLSSHDHPLLGCLDGCPHAYRVFLRLPRLCKTGAYERRSPLSCRTASNGGSKLRINSPTKSPPITSRLQSRNMSKGVVGSWMVCAVWSIVMPTRPHLSRCGGHTDRPLLSAQKLSWGNTPLCC